MEVGVTSEAEIGEWGELDDSVDSILRTILPNEDTFPKLRCLRLHLSTGFNYHPPPFTFPFSSLTKVSHLELGRLRPISSFAPLPGGLLLPALRSLVLRECCFSESRWFIQFLGRIREQGILRRSHLTVEDCSWIKPGDMLGPELSEYVDVTADEMWQLTI